MISMCIVGCVSSLTTALHYVNPNLHTHPATKTMRTVEDIPMGTILAIDQPLINLPHNFTQFTQRFFKLYADDPFQQLVQSFPKVDITGSPNFTNPLMNSLPANVRLDGVEPFHLLREYHLLNSIHHLTWNSVLYPTLPFIKTGFQANVAIFENHHGFAGDSCIVI
eukprot:762085_1